MCNKQTIKKLLEKGESEKEKCPKKTLNSLQKEGETITNEDKRNKFIFYISVKQYKISTMPAKSQVCFSANRYIQRVTQGKERF